MKTGIELIAQERAEQIEKHGRTVVSDVEYNSKGQLLQASNALMNPTESGVFYPCPDGWDYKIWGKMMSEKSMKKRIVIAGALIAAEIDRIQSE